MQTTFIYRFLLVFLMAVSILTACTSASPTVSVQTTDTPQSTLISETEEFNTFVMKTATPLPTPTISPKIESMQKDMEKLAYDRLVSSAAGKYYSVQDFTGEWAKLAYYHWWPLNRKPTNFAIRADVNWETAIPNANPSKAGCGFVFHENGPDNLHLSFLSMDGYVRNYRMEKRVISDLKANYAGKFDYPADSAKIMLVVDYQWITFFVDGKQILRFKDDHLNGGGLAFAVASGSNNSFGTRCTFQNVELWEFN